MNFYDQFTEATSEARNDFVNSEGFTLFREKKANKLFYAHFLKETYHLSRHTSRFLSAVVSNLPDEKDEIRTRFMHHAIEEDGHHKFTLKDIVNLGYPIEFITESQPLCGTTAIVSYHYFIAHYGNPISMMGAVIVFEGVAEEFAGELSDSIREQHDLPLNAVTFLHTHGKFDVDHMEEARKVMNTLINDDKDKKEIIEVANKMYRFLKMNFDDFVVLSQKETVEMALQH